MDNNIVFVLAAGFLALGFSFWKTSWIEKQDQGTKKMIVIGSSIADGAMAFLRAEYRVLSIFVIAVAIILDDVDLPLGTLRIRPKGGDGCHKGLENIIYQIRTNELIRMRLGIAEPLKETRPSEEYVLKPFHENNHKEVDLMIQQSVEAMECLLVNGLNQTMNKYNS